MLVAIAMLILDDLLLKYQYENDRESWVANGRPRGFTFAPDDSSLLEYWKQSFQPFEKKYTWAKNHAETKTLYKVLLFLKRVLLFYAILFLPMVFIVLLIS